MILPAIRLLNSGIIDFEDFKLDLENENSDKKKVLKSMCLPNKSLDFVLSKEFRENQEKIILKISSNTIKNRLRLLNAEFLIGEDFTLINQVAQILNNSSEASILENCTKLIENIIVESGICLIIDSINSQSQLIFTSETCIDNDQIKLLENCIDFSSTFTTLLFDKILMFCEGVSEDSLSFYYDEYVEFNANNFEERLELYLKILEKSEIDEFPKLNKLVSLAKFKEFLIIFIHYHCNFLPSSMLEVDEIFKEKIKKVLEMKNYGELARNFILKHLMFIDQSSLENFIRNTLFENYLIDELSNYRDFLNKLESYPYVVDSNFFELQNKNFYEMDCFETFIWINLWIKQPGDFKSRILGNLHNSIIELFENYRKQVEHFREDSPKEKFYFNLGVVYLVACKKFRSEITIEVLEDHKYLHPLKMFQIIQRIIRSNRYIEEINNLDKHFSELEQQMNAYSLPLSFNMVIHAFLDSLNECENKYSIQSELITKSKSLLNNLVGSVRDYKKFIFTKYLKKPGSIIEIIEEFEEPSDDLKLLRYTKTPQLQHLKESPKIRDKNSSYICVKEISNHEKQLKFIHSFYPMLSFTYKLIETYTLRISRSEAGKKRLSEYIEEYEPKLRDGLETELRDFLEACENYNKHRPETIPSLPKLTRDCTLNYFLLDENPNDNGRFITQALKHLVGVYNSFTDEIKLLKSTIMPHFDTSNRFYKIQLQIIPNKRAEEFLMDNLSKLSLNNPNFGLGNQIYFDFERIELNLSSYLNFDKSLDISSLMFVKFSDELLKSCNKNSGVIQALRNIFNQREKLAPEEKQKIKEYLKNQFKNFEFLKLLQVIMVYIHDKRSNKEQSIKSCAEEMGHNSSKPLRTESKLTQQRICFIVEIYELVEEIDFDQKENLLEKIKETNEQVREINNFLKDIKSKEALLPNKEQIRTAWMRMIFRNADSNIDKKQKISELISDDSLWDDSLDAEKKAHFIDIVSSILTFDLAPGIYERIANKQAKVKVEHEILMKASASRTTQLKKRLNY